MTPERAFPMPDKVERTKHDGSPIDDTEGFAVAPPPSSETPAASALSVQAGEELTETLSALRKSDSERRPLDIDAIYAEAGAGAERDTPAPVMDENSPLPDPEAAEAERLDQKMADERLEETKDNVIGAFHHMCTVAEAAGVADGDMGIAQFLRNELPEDADLMQARIELQHAINAYVRLAREVREQGLKSHILAKEITDLATE